MLRALNNNNLEGGDLVGHTTTVYLEWVYVNTGTVKDSKTFSTSTVTSFRQTFPSMNGVKG